MTYWEMHYLLHKLWTTAVGTEGYKKQDWKDLEFAFEQLWTQTGEPRGRPTPEIQELRDRPYREEPAQPVLSIWERLRAPFV